jgi:uncharacterized membrane protein
MGDQQPHDENIAQALRLILDMEIVTQFLGRFHPLIVHLPIGFLLLAFIFECLSLFDPYKKLKVAVGPSLLLGAAAAVIACITGYFLKQEGGYEDGIVNLHQILGITTATFSIALYVLREKLKLIVPEKKKRKKVKVCLFVPLILLLGLTGHWGGSLTHGEDYLSIMEVGSEQSDDPARKIRAIVNLDTAILYETVIQPLLEARCYSCHSSKKQKGELRLDSPELIGRGGKNGAIITAGLADSSSLYKRLMLPSEDEHHMPPNEKTQLSSTEIALIQVWIGDGASFTKTVSGFTHTDKLITYLKSFQSSAEESWIPEAEVSEADKKGLETLKAQGVLVMPVSASSNYLAVNFVNARSVTDAMLSALTQMKDQVIYLNLGFTSITDEQMTKIGELQNLRMLHLNNTAITDKGISSIHNLKALRNLNLVGTSTTDSTLAVLKKMDQLKNVYLYQTRMSQAAMKDYASSASKLFVDTGNYQVRKLPTDTIIYKRKI